MATATAPAVAPATVANHPTADKLRTIVSELGTDFYERRDHIEALILGDLSSQHTFLLGPPGVGKSALVRATCSRVDGARYWETLFDRQLPLETLFGPIDIIEFEKSGNWHRRVDGYLPTAHKAFGDEVGKAGPAVLNPLLTALNERLYHNNSKPMSIPLISFVGASNEQLEPELGAIWDRFLIRMIVNPIVEPSNFASLMQSAVTPVIPTTAPTTVTLDELNDAIHNLVPQVSLPPGIVDVILQLRADLRSDQVEPSDRRWKQSVRLLQASAFLGGRDAVDDDDLAVLRHVLWDVAPQIPIVEKKVLSLTSPMTKGALELDSMLEEIEGNISSRSGQSVESRAQYGGEAQFKVTEISKKLKTLTEQAKRAGRSTTRLDAVNDRLKATKVRIFVECMNVPADRAKLMGN